jgi:hypothetical protein
MGSHHPKSMHCVYPLNQETPTCHHAMACSPIPPIQYETPEHTVLNFKYSIRKRRIPRSTDCPDGHLSGQVLMCGGSDGF